MLMIACFYQRLVAKTFTTLTICCFKISGSNHNHTFILTSYSVITNTHPGFWQKKKIQKNVFSIQVPPCNMAAVNSFFFLSRLQFYLKERNSMTWKNITVLSNGLLELNQLYWEYGEMDFYRVICFHQYSLNSKCFHYAILKQLLYYPTHICNKISRLRLSFIISGLLHCLLKMTQTLHSNYHAAVLINNSKTPWRS